MTVDPKHSNPDQAATPITEWEEHGHVGGVEGGAPFKSIFGAPATIKVFPSLSSGFIYTAIAKPGTASGASEWRVVREQRNTGTTLWANGSSAWENNLVDITGLTYL